MSATDEIFADEIFEGVLQGFKTPPVGAEQQPVLWIAVRRIARILDRLVAPQALPPAMAICPACHQPWHHHGGNCGSSQLGQIFTTDSPWPPASSGWVKPRQDLTESDQHLRSFAYGVQRVLRVADERLLTESLKQAYEELTSGLSALVSEIDSLIRVPTDEPEPALSRLHALERVRELEQQVEDLKAPRPRELVAGMSRSTVDWALGHARNGLARQEGYQQALGILERVIESAFGTAPPENQQHEPR